MKSRKVKAAAKSKAFISKKKLKGNIPLETFSDSDADVDTDALFYDEKRDGRDNDLSTDDELIAHHKDDSEEEEVLPITDDESEDFENENQVGEDEESEEDEERGLPSKEAWGSKKSTYYNADFVDEDRGRTYREEDAEKARAEAEEAYAMQMSVSSLAANCATEILQLQTTEEASKDESEEEINLDSLDSKHKLKYLKKKYPELLLYIAEFKEKISELKDKIVPLLELVNSGKTPSDSFTEYVKVKYQALLHYCMNISFYMVLKSKGEVLSNHPVFQRINSFKNILDRMNGNDNFGKEVDLIISKLQRNEEINFMTDEPSNNSGPEDIPEEECIQKKILKTPQAERKKGKKSKEMDTEAEREIFSLYMDLKKQKKDKDPVSDEEKMEEDDDAAVNDNKVTGEKRTITYQIAKNKGLTAKRKKEQRNPRVHNKIKFRKAQIRRKGQVKNVIKEVTRYAGEPTGISAHVVRSRKLK